jgi:hypothetical protein
MHTIKLNFINKSLDSNPPNVIFFQDEKSRQPNEVVAWKVINDCETNGNHEFHYPMNLQLASSDSWGNFTPQMTAYDGQAYEMTKDSSGDVMQLSSSPSSHHEEIEVRNNLSTGSVSANIYKDGKLLLVEPHIPPGQKAVFNVKPKLRVGIVPNVNEGDKIESATINQVNTEIDLFGVVSADLVLTGGGSGKSSSNYTFKLENIKHI